VQFDIRSLIGPPYIECPNCKKPAFGVISVNSGSYDRRCRECHFKNDGIPLWPTEKKVIYIDQFAISNMAKALNDKMKGHENAAADPLWLKLFEALERVCKLQLAICPDSTAHRDESLVSAYFAPLKRMYEQLSHGVSFDAPETIDQRQLSEASGAWIRGKQPTFNLDAQRVTSSGLHDWQPRYIISVQMTYPPDMVEAIRKARDTVRTKVAEAFEYYQKGPKDFDYWIKHESRHGGQAILEGKLLYERSILRMAKEGNFSFEGVYRCNGNTRFDVIAENFMDSDVKQEDVLAKVTEFVSTDSFNAIPSNAIETLMWAGIAFQAANGRVRVPSRGMISDISVISSLLPYCDAMLIDNECRELVAKAPARFRPPYPTKLFSTNTSDEFLAYLKEIEDTADEAVLHSAKELYGPDGPKPFMDMYKDKT
jgi:hypothetical protein